MAATTLVTRRSIAAFALPADLGFDAACNGVAVPLFQRDRAGRWKVS